MDRSEKYNAIIEKLNDEMKFGMFEKGMKCYFQDGTHISYNDLWKAIRIHKNLETAANTSLAQLFPETYVGTHKYRHTQHNWKKSNEELSAIF